MIPSAPASRTQSSSRRQSSVKLSIPRMTSPRFGVAGVDPHFVSRGLQPEIHVTEVDSIPDAEESHVVPRRREHLTVEQHTAGAARPSA